MTPWLLVRSILNTPALDPARFAKGWALGADMVSLDLEDGVPKDRKAEARAHAVTFLKKRLPEQLLSIRINSVASPEGMRDLLAIAEGGHPPDAILLPKVQGPEDVRVADRFFRNCGFLIRFLPVIEDAPGLANAIEIAACSPNVAGLIFGSADYCHEMEIEMDSSQLLYAKQRLVVAAKAADVVPFDTPFFELGDAEGLEQECRASRQIGFRGKVLIHPDQIGAAHRAFRPSPSALEEARQVVEASEGRSGEITVLKGQMIGPPFVKRAYRLLEEEKRFNKAPQSET